MLNTALKVTRRKSYLIITTGIVWAAAISVAGASASTSLVISCRILISKTLS